MAENVFLNGRYCQSEEARVSIEDRGFIFGDGVYEVLRCYGGHLFKIEEHLLRLERSASRIDLPLPYTGAQWGDICRTLVQKSGAREAVLYLQVTRGSAPRVHCFPSASSPTVMMKVYEINEEEVRERKKGIRAVTVPDERWQNCDIKCINLLPNVLAKEKARENGAYEAIFIGSEGASECATSNVFCVRGGKVITAPAERRILAGISRGVVLKLAREAGLEVELAYPPAELLQGAEEIFITNTVDEVAPVTDLDGKAVGRGAAGPLTLRLQEMFRELVQNFLRTQQG